MWLEAVDIVLQRLKEKGTPFQSIKGISGAGQQHGSVYWSITGEKSLGSLKPEGTLVDQLKEAFAHPFSPNWQDGSTQKECDKFDAELGSPEKLAQVTGSKAHHVSNTSKLPTYFPYKRGSPRASDSRDPKSCECTKTIQRSIGPPPELLSSLHSWLQYSSAALHHSTSVMFVE